MNPLNQQHQYQGGLGNGNNGGSANLATPPPIPTSSPSPHNLHPPPHILTSSANPSPNVQQQQLQLQQQQQQQLQLQAAAAAKKSRSGYKEHELAQIRNSLRPYEQAEQHAAAAAAAAAAASGHQHHLAAAAAAPSLAAAGKQQQLLKGAATSVQTLLKLGFSEDLVRLVLTQTGGRLDAAVDLLQRHYNASLAANDDYVPLPPSRTDLLNGNSGQQQQQQQQHNHPSSGGNNNNQLPPALPPRDRSGTTAHPSLQQHALAAHDAPPPPPPPRSVMNPPPTPPRGTTPPPLPPPSSSQQQQQANSMGPLNGNLHHPSAGGGGPPLLRRMSPVPRVVGSSASSVVTGARGTSPITTAPNTTNNCNGGQQQSHPLRVQNSREIQQQFQQTLQSMQTLSFFDNAATEPPPPPYPMQQPVSASGGSNPPPSYSQSLAMRQSPTLSSTSSDLVRTATADFRRSPGPNGGQHSHYSHLPHVGGGGGSSGAGSTAGSVLYPVIHPGGGIASSPITASPSPASSMMSATSSRTSSSMQAAAAAAAGWSARQAKTQSPVIMQSVKSIQVQKPVLQTATAVTPTPEATAATVISAGGGNGGGPVPDASKIPPPSYELSMAQKQSTTPTPLSRPPSAPTLPPPSPKQRLPPPPPYPSTAVRSSQQQQQHQQQEHHCGENGMLVNGTAVSGKQVPVISTAKVVNSNSNVAASGASKLPLQRKYSPAAGSMPPPPPPISSAVAGTSSSVMPGSTALGEAACSSAGASRSESPVSSSDAQTVSPLSFVSSDCHGGPLSAATDSGMAGSSSCCTQSEATTHHTSPKPLRRSQSSSINGGDCKDGNLEEVEGEEDLVNRVSLIKNCPPQAYKFYMEQRIENVIKEYEQRRNRQRRLEQELSQVDSINSATREQMRLFLKKKETNYLRMKRAKLKRKDFKKIQKIGVGGFGEVFLVRCKNSSGKSGALYAMKTLKKSHVVEQNQVAHVIAEKDILAEADNDWIVKLFFSFQDKGNLYFILEYIPGGDLMNLLIQKGTFEESMARFYIAELTCAVESVHAMGFIHRDIKPDNILIDSAGHIKLTDFGLCTGFRWTHNSKYYSNNGSGHCRQDSMDPGTLDLESGRCSCNAISSLGGMKPLERRKRQQQLRCMAHSLVGTPNYIAPEVLQREGYTQSSDWWSVGVILYEMIIGQPPFFAESKYETQRKVIHWAETLRIPSKPRISPESEDLIRKFCTDAERRLGSKNGAKEIKLHPFFNGIDFSVPLRKQRAPHKPEIMNELDTSNFDTIPDEPFGDSEAEMEEDNMIMAGLSQKDYQNFPEFTFRRFFSDSGHPLRLDEPYQHPTHLGGPVGGSAAPPLSTPPSSGAGAIPPDPVYV